MKPWSKLLESLAQLCRPDRRENGARRRRTAFFQAGLLLTLFCLYLRPSLAATFSGDASISAGGDLSAVAPNNALTVSCWFRITIPTGTNLTENMVILMDRSDGNVNSTFSYLIQFNIANGSVEYLTRGSSGAYTNLLIARPYLDRWYHVAVVRQNSSFSAYVDGRALATEGANVGTASGSGLSIGGHHRQLAALSRRHR